MTYQSRLESSAWLPHLPEHLVNPGTVMQIVTSSCPTPASLWSSDHSTAYSQLYQSAGTEKSERLTV